MAVGVTVCGCSHDLSMVTVTVRVGVQLRFEYGCSLITVAVTAGVWLQLQFEYGGSFDVSTVADTL